MNTTTSQRSLDEIIGSPIAFLKELFSRIDDIELDVAPYFLDHICYRVESIADYQRKKEQLSHHGELLIESIVNGRLISTYKLHIPIEFNNRKIELLELPSPKAGHVYKAGLEHAEFVTKDPLQKIVNKYPQYAFEVFGIHKKINADITLKLGDFCIRFHNQSLEDVIKLEKQMIKKNYK